MATVTWQGVGANVGVGTRAGIDDGSRGGDSDVHAAACPVVTTFEAGTGSGDSGRGDAAREPALLLVAIGCGAVTTAGVCGVRLGRRPRRNLAAACNTLTDVAEADALGAETDALGEAIALGDGARLPRRVGDGGTEDSRLPTCSFDTFDRLAGRSLDGMCRRGADMAEFSGSADGNFHRIMVAVRFASRQRRRECRYSGVDLNLRDSIYMRECQPY